MERLDCVMTVTEGKYRPLPNYLTIKKSDIDGLGLFAVKFIRKNTCIGVTHLTDFINKKLYRTPLGGFINHSEEPNCKLEEIHRFKYLTTIKTIKPGEELTLKYTLYDPTI